MICLGSIIGDIAGAGYEFQPKPSYDDIHLSKLNDGRRGYTDDTVCTIAIMDWLNSGDLTQEGCARSLMEWGQRYPLVGYGHKYREWLINGDISVINDSFGNGSAMRIAPIAWYSDDINECLELAKISCLTTHSHEESIKGAQATVLAMCLAKQFQTKELIKENIEKIAKYDLSLELNEIGLLSHPFDATCQVTVPEALICFLKSDNYEDCIKKAISIGGDTDTIAAIAGGIAEMYYGIPDSFKRRVWDVLPDDMKDVICYFTADYLNKHFSTD